MTTPEEKLAAEMYRDKALYDTSEIRAAFRHGYRLGDAEGYARAKVEDAAQARGYASHYPQRSDGRNTFMMLADWIESRRALSPTSPAPAAGEHIVGEPVHIVAGDYDYHGRVAAIFQKIKSGEVRYVVEDDRGRLFIHGPRQIHPGEGGKEQS